MPFNAVSGQVEPDPIVPIALPPSPIATPNEDSDFLSSSRTVGMVAPDGKTYMVPGTGVEKAVSNGWSLASKPEEHKARLEANTIAEDQSKGLLGSVEAGSKAFFNQALMGVPEVIQQHTQNSNEQEISDIKEAQHPIATTIGNVAGFGGSLALGGGIGEAAGELAGTAVEGALKAGIGQRILGSVAKDAAQAAVFSAPQAVAQASYGDPETAAETMLIGVGAGGILGGVLGTGKEALKAVGGGLSGSILKGSSLAEKLSAKADELALGQNEISGIDARKLGKSKLSQMADFLKQENQYGNKVSRDAFQAIHDEAGEKIGAHLDSLDNDIANHVPDISKGEMKLSSQLDPLTIAQTIENKVRENYPGLDTSLGKGAKKALTDITDSILQFGAEKPGDLTFADSNKLKNILDPGKWDATVSNDVNAVKKLAYSTFKSAQEEAADKTFTAIDGNQERFNDYLKQKSRYKNASDFLAKGPQVALNQFGVLSPSHGLTGLGARSAASAMGGMIGGPAGVAAGWVAAPLLKRLFEDRGLPFVIKGMKKMAEEGSPFLGGMIAKTGKEALDKVLADIPQTIKTGMKVAPSASINPIKSFLGQHANGLSKDQQYKKLVTQLTESATDPTYATNEVAKLVQVFGNDDHLANLVAQKHFQAIDYLYQALPKDTSQPKPFQKDQWTPTPEQKRDFLNKLAIVENPLVAIHKIGNGTITRQEMQTLQDVYPKIHQQFQQAIIASGYQPGADKISYEKKILLSKVVGQPLDPSLEPANLQALQKTYSMPAPQEDNSPSQPKSNKLAGKGPSMQTNTQRLERGIGKNA